MDLQSKLLRCHSAPSIITTSPSPASTAPSVGLTDDNFSTTPWIVKQALIGITLYLTLCATVYILLDTGFSGVRSGYPLVDALYFTTVTLSTVGYGDLVPATTLTKLVASVFVVVCFGFINILLNGLVTYVLDRQEALLLNNLITEMAPQTVLPLFQNCVMDVKKKRVRVRMKVGLALGAVAGCIAAGAIGAHILEGISWGDSVYLAVTSVTTVGYGDYAFKRADGRAFAVVWLMVSTVVVGRGFLYLTELRIEKRNKTMNADMTSRKMMVAATDVDKNGPSVRTVSKSEFVIYKLKEMGKITEKDVMETCEQFERLDTGNCGKITLSDLTESHRH